MGGITRRQFGATAAAAAAWLHAPDRSLAQQRATLNDASGLNPVSVFSHWIARAEPEAAFIARLRKELASAAAENRPVAVGAARHSMGGQSLPRDGAAMTFNVNRCEADTASRTYRVHAGTRWFEVIATLDRIGFSPVVMQSNNDFGVASTFSVNSHGWPVPRGPFGSTVRSFRLMLADGTIVTCSRTENPELFGLVMGGYGLFGIILDLDVEMTENLWLRPRFEVMPAAQFGKRFVDAISSESEVRMAYGRLNVTRNDFLSEAVLVTFRSQPIPSSGLPPATRGGVAAGLTRRIYRAQLGSETGKRARWIAETVVAPRAAGAYSRNTLLNSPVSNLANRDRRRTDILHEYFVAPERFNEFIEGCRAIIPKSRVDFLNVTLRYVRRDETAVLAYATTDRIAAVMSFSQLLTPEAEADMRRTTEALIELVASLGGSFYLPYRLHARLDQVGRVYANMARFVERKRHYDPGLVFRNLMWEAYFAG